MVKWQGAWYYREGRLKGEPSSWRNRNTNRVVDGGRNLSKSELMKRTGKNVEITRFNPYGRNPRSPQQARSDIKTFRPSYQRR